MTSKPSLPLKIDSVSDVICPWCVLGYLQLQQVPGAQDPATFERVLRRIHDRKTAR